MIKITLLLWISALVSIAHSQVNMPSPAGKLIDVGGYKLHLHIQGRGNIPVVFENGSGDFSFIWSLVQPEISKITKTVSYDRAGYAWSDPGPLPRTGEQITLELHTALHKAGINTPFIMVGQSFGGFLVREYARRYPEDVSGLVFVDVLHENSRILIGGKPMRIREFATGKTIHRAIRHFKPVIVSDTIQWDTIIYFPLNKLSKEIQKQQIWSQSQNKYKAASNSEMESSPEDVANLYKHKGEPDYTFGHKPLIVLSRGDGGYLGRPDSTVLENERIDLQNDLSKLSSNSLHITDKNSGHNIHLEDPNLVIAAILEVLNSLIEKRPLRSFK